MSTSGVGITIADELFNSFAYADDNNLMRLERDGLQIILN